MLISLFKTSKTSSLLQLRYSRDLVVNSSNPNLDTGKKWKLSEAVKGAESTLNFQRILGHTQTGNAGLGYTPSKSIPSKGTKEYRKAVSLIVAKTHDETVLATEEGKKLQTNWTSWSNFVRNDLSWKCIWALGVTIIF